MTEQKKSRPTTEKRQKQMDEHPDKEFPVFGFFPEDAWKEWTQHCEDHHSNIRWAKAMSDHQLARQWEKEQQMIGMIVDLQRDNKMMSQRIYALEQNTQLQDALPLGQEVRSEDSSPRKTDRPATLGEKAA